MLLGVKPERNICWEDCLMGWRLFNGAVLPSLCLSATQAQRAVQTWSGIALGLKLWSENTIPTSFLEWFYVDCSRTGVKPTNTNLIFQHFWKCFSWQGEFILDQSCCCSGLDPWDRICCVVRLPSENQDLLSPHATGFVPECIQMQELLLHLS